MKKAILPLFVLITLPVLAKPITANTQIKWTPIVVIAAANSVGLESYYGTHPDVSLTYNRIMADLLKRETFSAIDATEVCKQQCIKSEFLKNGKGESGRKCPEICEDFGNALVAENNKKTNSLELGDGYYHPAGRVYTQDKQFYAETQKNDNGVCSDAVFETATNKKIAVCSDSGWWGEDGSAELNFKIIDSQYSEYKFTQQCDHSLLVEDEGGCSLYVESPKSKYEFTYKKFEPCINNLRSINFSDVNTLIMSDDYDLLDDYRKDDLQTLYKVRDYNLYASRFTPTSYNLENDLNNFLDKYCVSFNQDYVEETKKDIAKAKALFADTKKYSNIQTKTLEEAIKQIKNYLWYNSSSIDRAKLQCSGKCNKTGQDYVTCTLGKLSATFEFDDICD